MPFPDLGFHPYDRRSDYGRLLLRLLLVDEEMPPHNSREPYHGKN